MKKIISILAVGLMVVALVGCGSNNTTENTTSEKETVKAEVKEDTKITYDNFLNVQMGQSYTDVVKLLGEGTEQTSSEVAGIKSVIYTWIGSGISNMSVTVQNDVVTGKAQVALKSMDADITLEKYNQITNGMTYDQVKEILGEGQILSQYKIMNVEAILYSYSNKGGSNANFTFSGGSLQAKAQFGLK